MIDPVRVSFKQGTSVYETTVERSYAAAHSDFFEVLPDAPVWAHGRLKGVTKKNGRAMKPPANLPPSIPGDPATHNESGDEAGGKSKE